MIPGKLYQVMTDSVAFEHCDIARGDIVMCIEAEETNSFEIGTRNDEAPLVVVNYSGIVLFKEQCGAIVFYNHSALREIV